MNVCTKCKEKKEDSEFPKDKNKKSGLSSWCKECKKEPIRLHHCELRTTEEYKAYISEYNKDYKKSEHGKKVINEYNKKYYNTEKGQLNSLRKRIKQTKKDSTKQRLQEQLKQLENEITRINIR